MRSCLSRFALPALAGLLVSLGSARAADSLLTSLKSGTPDIKSAGALAFAPEGILLVGDAQSAAIFAIDTGDRKPSGEGAINVEGIDEKIAAMLGTDAKSLLINDLAVNPLSGNAYLSVARGKGPTSAAVLVRVERNGKIGPLDLKDVKFAKATLSNPSEKNRGDAITALAYTSGKVIVAGLSNEEFASKLRTIPFPFADADKGASIEIFHGAHGKIETHAPVRTLAIYDINGDANVLAAYTCTPLVKIPLSQLKPGEKVKGTTVAELGNGNKPLDMVVYNKGGKDYILIANNNRGVMKVSTEGIDKIEPITKRTGVAGLKYETITSLKGVEQLARFDKDHALVLIKTESGARNLSTVELP